MATDSDRIAAPGIPVTLLDGRVVNLRYTFRALKLLEDEFGSLGAATDSLSKGDAAFGPLLSFLKAGLFHEAIHGQLIDLLDPKRIAEYGQAVAAGLTEALPAAGDSQGEGQATPAESNGSRGVAPTTSPPSATDAQTPISG